MFCENCGAPLEDGARFCPNCGTKVIGDAPKPAPASSYTAPAPSGEMPPSARAYGAPSATPTAATPQQPGKLYYPDPKRYTTFMGPKTFLAMNRADDVADFPDD